MRQLVQYMSSVKWHLMLPEINQVAQLSFQGGHVSGALHFIVEEIYKKLHKTVGTVQVQCNVAFNAS